jgi:hypothetical protein
MAVLSDADRQRIWRGVLRSALFGAVPNNLKTDLRAAVDATDAWIDSNASSYNVALPQPFRNNATAAQKTLLFCFVALMRANLGGGLLRIIVGEVD